MKHNYLIISVLILLSTALSGQSVATRQDSSNDKSWLEMMQDPDVNFKEAQQKFNAYWENRTDTKGNGYKVFKRWEYINELRILPNGKLRSPDYVLSEYNRYMRNQNDLRSSGGNWSLLAPYTYPVNSTGQPTGMGRINAIAFHPSDPNTIYIGVPAGGIWKTTNHGTSWIDLSANIPTLGVSSIIVDPTDPNIIYIGTGDRDGGNAPGIGVYKSTNAGVTWNAVNNTMGNVVVGDLIMHPANNNILIAATNTGIYRTTNGGSTWTLTSIAGNFKDIQFKPGDPDIVYAVRITTPSLFYRSSDNGNSWTNITSGIPTSSIGSRMVIGVSVGSPTTVYLVQIKSNNTFAGILRSTDSGVTFTKMTASPEPNILGYECDASGTASQATYDLCINVDQSNANTLYVGGINTWKSTDAGVNWQISTVWAYTCSGTAATVHADHHTLERNPLNNRLYLGHDGGISYTANNGTSWIEITGPLPITQIYKIGGSASQSNLFIYGQQDNGTNVVNGSALHTVRDGDGTESVIDYSTNNYCYNTYIRGEINRSSSGVNGTYSAVAKTGSFGIGSSEAGAWVTPYFLHKSNPSIMFAGYENVFRCDNIKASPASSVAWTAISTSETTTCSVLEQSPVNVDILYVVRSSQVKRTNNANAIAASVVWTACALPGGTTPTDIKAHPSDANIVYATAGNRVYKSINQGALWTDISGNLPYLYINCMVIDKNASEGLYIGNETGVWYKNATMVDWVLFSHGLPPVDIRELEIYYDGANPTNNRISAATYGRGLWQSDLIEVNVVNPNSFVGQGVSPSQINLSWVKNVSNNDVIIAWSPTILFGQPADGVNYSLGNTLPNGGGTVLYKGSLNTFNHTGLTTNTTYYYKIWSVNGSNQYSAGLPYISASTDLVSWTGAISTDWFTSGNWSPNTVPTSSLSVLIPSAPANQPIINASGSVCFGLFIDAGATLTMSNTNPYTLTVHGQWTNIGNFSAGMGTVDFAGTNDLQIIRGASAIAFNALSVSKGDKSKILEVTSLITLNAASNRLIINSGTFKLSSASTITPFTSSATIGSTTTSAGLWINGGTVNSGNFSWFLDAGSLRISSGIVNVGTNSGNTITYLNGGSLQMEGGSLNIAGRFQPNSGSSSGSFIQTGGVITVNTVGSTSSTRAPFEINSGVPFAMSGGTIVVQKASSNAADYINLSSSASVTGGTLQIGNASTPASQTIRINSTVPVYNLTVHTTNMPTARLVTNGLTILNHLDLGG
ncbi:MAG: hypothetical protein WBO36_06390, partial [Saprospiraceae bacterium]